MTIQKIIEQIVLENFSTCLKNPPLKGFYRFGQSDQIKDLNVLTPQMDHLVN